MKRIVISILLLFLLVTIVSAQEIALDIKVDKQIYSAGENISYQILLLKDNFPITDSVNISISDMADTKILSFIVEPNIDQSLFVEKDFPSGYWKIEASYENKSVKRFFSIGEREEAEFSIDNDKLIIKNTGNTQYTKEVQILIGEKLITQKQNIEVGGFKEIKLVAPNGKYNIQVSDGKQSISRSDIYLVSTGNVIGALDENLVKNPPSLGIARDVKSQDNILSSKNFPLLIVFLAAVFGIFGLMAFERYMKKRKLSQSSN
jgi:hypothetical protein